MPRKKTMERVVEDCLLQFGKAHLAAVEDLKAKLAISNSYWERTNSALQMLVREVGEIKRPAPPGDPRDQVNIGRVLNALLEQLEKPPVENED